MKKRKTRNKYLKENIEPLLLSSKSISEVLRKMGLRAAGGNHAIIKKYIKKYKISVSHFTPQSERIKSIVNRFVKKPLEELLVENNFTSNSAHIKDRLYKEGLKKRECERCGQGEIWMGKNISLILDHKNGVHSDWRLMNLEILCPNCNATLDTHCGKNKRKRKCIDCGRNIKKRKRCMPCYRKFRRGYPLIKNRRYKDRPSKEKIIEIINKHGYSFAGRMFGVSDNAIRKWIK